MNFLNIFEDHVASIFGASRAPFSFKKLAKRAAREMEQQTLSLDGVNTAPALYTILVASADDPLLSPYYIELAREVSDFVKAQIEKKRFALIGEPLVRFMVDPSLKEGKFTVFAENVDAPTLGRLYEEERAYQSGLSAGGGEEMRPVRDTPADPREPRSLRGSVPLVSSRVPSPIEPAAGVAGAAVADPFAPTAPDPAVVPVRRTVPRDELLGLGGAAATGAESVAVNMVGSRAPQAPAQPLAHLVDVVTGDIFNITEAQCIIGRERSMTDITLRDPNVSRRHARLTFTGADWSIEDLNSTNGTHVNNRPVSRSPLRSGDLLTFGLNTFEFRG
ncbi:FHA domain containing protein [Coriobacterium glomerans PW2]|uniref:FHA domain containing protein n=1 Tax=Coriobacterium glomerans (strain ATCC 49209 / DSM 20642 / JCM 10262 / PW2) TaxID=700015 RepID=F2N976_CORGP|nr:FhaA domain-containing protein [Coriobacterium glomerans]AEB07752.1 FHA domain containing protein [Coriobacterium glomerans PW2]